MNRNRAFTLIELLVVVAIISLLVGITVPSLRAARETARRTVCKKNLSSIGFAIQDYLLRNRETFFYARRLRKIEENKAAVIPGYVPLPSLPEALKRELRGKTDVFLCPSDENTSEPMVPTRRYFDYEDSSYEWETTLNGKRLHPKGVYIVPPPSPVFVHSRNMWMVMDFEPFHGPPDKKGSFNSLYADFRVESQ